jgi:peptidoglycan/xylan/chitin deacetylase (PgdA/CDA1 family)
MLTLFVRHFLFIFAFGLIATSCGLVHLGEKNISRNIAASAIEKLVTDEETSFQEDIAQKLYSLYCYYLIGQKNLLRFEKKIPLHEASSLYSTPEYLSLLATKGEIDDVEKELAQVYFELSKGKNTEFRNKKKIFLSTIEQFQSKSTLHHLSLLNLSSRIGVDNHSKDSDISEKTVITEINQFEKDSEFFIYEKNIEHLSHMMEMNLKSDAKRWEPSEGDTGMLSGEEFPPQTWSLTFSLGPKMGLSQEILKLINLYQIKSTFFVAADQLKSFNEFHLFQSSLVEMAVHSMSNVNLTKVGEIALHREVTEAKELVEKKLGKKIKFYRLPLGAGQRDLPIRDLIAKNKLINILWNVDTIDWIPQTSERIVNRTKEIMKKTKHDSGIILFHDVYPRAISAARDIMSHLSKGSRKTCHLSGIVTELNSNGKISCH